VTVRAGERKERKRGKRERNASGTALKKRDAVRANLTENKCTVMGAKYNNRGGGGRGRQLDTKGEGS